MRFRELYLFELRHHLRNIATWLLLAAMFLFAFLLLRLVTLDEGTHLNAPGTIAFFTVFAGVIWIVIGGFVAGEAATRDVQRGIHPLTFTTPVHKIDYLGARFAGAITINALIFLSLHAGMLTSYYGPGARTEFIGPFRSIAYVTNFMFLAFPIIFVATAIQFSAAAISRRVIASYIASILLLMFSQFAGTTVRFALEWKLLGGLMDLLGTSILMEMEGWTPLEKNTRLISLEGSWLWNRVVWFSIGSIALVYTYTRFSLSHFVSRPLLPRFLRRTRISFETTQQELVAKPISVNISSILSPKAPQALIFFLQTLNIASDTFKAVVTTRGALYLVLILAIITGIFATEYMEWLGVSLYARTQEILTVIAPPLSSFQSQWIIIPILTIFYSGEILWRERDARLNDLTDTSPVSESVFYIGKLLGLIALLFTWIVFLMMAGIINQLVMGYYDFELDVYIQALFGIQLTNYVLFAVLVFTIHIVVNQKYLGHMLGMAAYGYILFAGRLGVEHKLLIYGADPGWSYSDMRGFEPFMKPWLWFKLHWIMWASLLSLISIVFWVRSREVRTKTRANIALTRSPQYKTIFLIVSISLLTSAGFIFYNTNILNRFWSNDELNELRARYEIQYHHYANAPQPELKRTKLIVELFPEERSANIHGNLLFTNNTSKTIDSLHFSTIPGLEFKKLSFDHNTTAALVDEELGYRIYQLSKGLPPGDTISMTFELTLENKGFSNRIETHIVSNGSHLPDSWMPVVGYDDNRRLRDPMDRRKYNLTPMPSRPSLNDTVARYDTRHARTIDFEAVVSTTKGQIAIAPGDLRQTWSEGDRQYFYYATNAPILNEFAIFSARYAVRESQWNSKDEGSKPVTIQVYYHPGHYQNIDRMLKSAEASLAYYSKEFGPYPYSIFRVVERPGAGRGMHAEPMTIDYQEGFSLMNPSAGEPDLAYHIMSHEVAHQWWGMKLSPAAVEGSGVLVESTATYSAMQVVEENLGYEHLMKYLSQMRLEYEIPRSTAAPPLLEANSRFMLYRKGPFAFYALRNYIGKDKVNDALRNILHKYGSANPPLSTTLDLVQELRAVTPDSLQYLIDDLFTTNTFWELETVQASAKQTGPDKWELTLEIDARKTVIDTLGITTEKPMNEWLDVGVYGLAGEGEVKVKELHLKRHKIHSGRQTIVIELKEKPGRAGIDPNHLIIDLDFENNMRRVKVDGVEEKNDPDLI